MVTMAQRLEALRLERGISRPALSAALDEDVASHREPGEGQVQPVDWVDLLAYLGARYGGDFSGYREQDLEDMAKMPINGEKTIAELASDMQYYAYYREAYGAVLDGMVGEYETEEAARPVSKEAGADKRMKRVYGLKAFHPIAKSFPYSDYDDFGASRSYGYARPHLGHDMMGQIGTPNSIKNYIEIQPCYNS